MLGMIHVTVKLLGPAADLLGDDTLEYALTPPATLANLLDMLFARHPELQSRARWLRFAVNEEYAELSQPLNEGDEVAVIPPVAGGADPPAPELAQPEPVMLTQEPISVASLVQRRPPSGGAVVTFEGVVRPDTNQSVGRPETDRPCDSLPRAAGEGQGGGGPAEDPLLALEYTAYEPMACKQMARLRREALTRFAITEAAIAHRLGRLVIGDTALAVAVWAPHRGPAFEACRWIVDTLKRDVPIWKREIWTRRQPTWAQPPPETP